jgi:hypothetical protein
MKWKQIEQIILSGKSVTTGRFQEYKAEQTVKAGCNEKFGVLVGKTVHDFTVWAPKGAKLSEVKRPAFTDKPGVVVAIIGADFRIDGKYLRTSAGEVVEIETGL